MPMDFPTHDDVLDAAKRWRFRDMYPNETEDAYRRSLADFVSTRDMVEAHEIRLGKGWDKWSPAQRADCLRR